MPKKLFVVAVIEGGVCTNVYAPDGTPIDYDLIDYDNINQGDTETLQGQLETLEYIAQVERENGQPVSVQDAIDKVRSYLPDDPAVDTERRADRGAELLAKYKAMTGAGDDEALGDLLTDLRHMSDRDNYDYDLANNRAAGHHAEEVRQQESGSWSARARESRTNNRQR